MTNLVTRNKYQQGNLLLSSDLLVANIAYVLAQPSKLLPRQSNHKEKDCSRIDSALPLYIKFDRHESYGIQPYSQVTACAETHGE